MITTLTRLEVEEQAAYDRGLDVQYTAPGDPRLKSEPARSVWKRGRITIFINRRLLEAEKLTLLLHERGHIETHNARWKRSDDASELSAWAWAYEYYLPLETLTEAAEAFYEGDALNVEALADHLGVTPAFVAGALTYYRTAARLLFEPEPVPRLRVI